MCKVSIIIPVYNSEKYLSRCLNSALNQTLRDIEIICVNDFSTDLSKDILESYAEMDERVKIIYNNRIMGVASSRNKAIEIALGEYIQFLDSDDYLNGKDVLELLYSLAIKNQLDLLKTGLLLLEDNKLSSYFEYPDTAINHVYTGKELMYRLESNGISARVCVSNFIRRDIIIYNNIRFYDGIIHEDVLYSFDLFYYALRAMCINENTYIYVKHENSITTRKKDINHLVGCLVCMKEILKKNLWNTTFEFRCAAIKYFIHIQNEIYQIIKNINCDINTELVNSDIKILYDMFIGKNLNDIKMEVIIQNIELIIGSAKRYIYGAGKAAEDLIYVLAEYDLSIDGIFVSNKKNNKNTFFGHKIMCFNEIENIDKNVLIMVAITQSKVGNVVEELHLKGYKNVIHVCS